MACVLHETDERKKQFQKSPPGAALNLQSSLGVGAKLRGKDERWEVNVFTMLIVYDTICFSLPNYIKFGQTKFAAAGQKNIKCPLHSEYLLNTP